jgi:phage shock protein A
MDTDLKIVELRAENFLRLKAVRIRPDGAMVEVTGKNGAGKTSALNAIAWAIGGKDFALEMPLRQGATEGAVQVDLGDLVITKQMTRAGDDIRVRLIAEYKDGSRPKTPQGVLDELRGHLMDPVAFVRAKPADRLEMVKSLFPDFDFAANARARKAAYDDRTDVNRDHKRAIAALGAIKLPPGPRPVAISVTEINQALTAATRKNEETRLRQQRRDDSEQEMDKLRGDAEKLRAQARAFEAKALELEDRLATAEPLPEIIDLEPFMQSVEQAAAVNAVVRKFDDAKALEDQATVYEQQSSDLTQKIDDLDKAKAAALSGGKLPFKGLAVTDDDVTLDGVPFDQCAFSTRLRAGAAIAMALEPRLHVMLIREYGSLLDKDSMKLLADIAEEHGWQVWIETVGDGGPGKVLIEDGSVAS